MLVEHDADPLKTNYEFKDSISVAIQYGNVNLLEPLFDHIDKIIDPDFVRIPRRNMYKSQNEYQKAMEIAELRLIELDKREEEKEMLKFVEEEMREREKRRAMGFNFFFSNFYSWIFFKIL